jgi:hypothetical protein
MSSIFTMDEESDAMIDDLFSAEHFSEVDTCVELLSRPPPTPRKKDANVSSRRGHGTSVSSNTVSLKSRSHRRPSFSGSHQSSKRSGDASRRSVHMQNMKEIDNDVDKLVREDVRKMIAKIRNSTQSNVHVHDDKINSNSTVDKKLIRPGKYGEVDLRSARAQARKELFLKAKHEKVQKRKAPDSRSTPAESKEARDQPEHTDNMMHQTEEATRTKVGYYRNTEDSSPEQVGVADSTTIKPIVISAWQNITAVNSSSNAEEIVARADTQMATSKANATHPKDSPTSESGQDVSTEEKSNRHSVDKASELEENQVEDNDDTSDLSTDEDLCEIHTTKVSILSMPKIEKSSDADDLEVIECVLATLTELEEEEKARVRELFGKKLDPSEDVEEKLETLTSPAEAGDGTEDDPPREKSQQPENRVFQADPGISLSPAPMATGVLVVKRMLEPVQTTEMAGMPSEAANMKQEDKNTTPPHDATEKLDFQTREETPTGGEKPDDAAVVELMHVADSDRVRLLEKENAKLRDALHFLRRTAVEKEKYFAELAWFGKRSEAEVKKWRPNFWRERLEDLGPELFNDFRADAMRIADPDVGDWEHGFSSGALAMARLLLGLSHILEEEKICAFHDPDQPCTKHCVTCTVAEQRARELADFPLLDP